MKFDIKQLKWTREPENYKISDNKIEICWNFDSGFFDLETMHKCG